MAFAVRSAPLVLPLCLLAACGDVRPVARTDRITACVACHGGEGDDTGAPPVDTLGRSDPSLVTVGAHAAHVRGSHAIASPIACDACHVKPTSSTTPGHIDASPAEISFGPAARANGADPLWRPEVPTCSNVHCHGATLRGGAADAPLWTSPPTAAGLGCAGCHGAPPARPHPPRQDRAACHAETVDESGAIRLAGGLHIDGVVQVSGTLGCTSCHGDASREETIALDRAAPPLDASGRRDSAAVGAHLAHLHGGAFSRAIGCGECHVVPQDTSHVDGLARVQFGPLARAGGAAPSFASPSCSATYCHGSFPGGAGAAPSWSSTANLSCASCHAAQPNTGEHEEHRDEGVACGSCHVGFSTGAVNLALHVNGRKDLGPGTGWNPASRTCANACHDDESW